MALFNVSAWQRSRFTLQWFIINLVGSMAWLSAVALAQFEWSEGVSGSVSIPDVAFTCIGNLAVFTTALMRGRLDMENGARDVLATTIGPKLNECSLRALSTSSRNDLRDVHVVMLSRDNNHSSLTQFVQYFSHSHDVESIILRFTPFRERCECRSGGRPCRCVVFWATEEIMIMLARRLPGTLKRLSKPDSQLPSQPDSQLPSKYLLPSLGCLENGCHGCSEGLLYVEAAGESSELGTSEGRLTEDNPRGHCPAAVCEALEHLLIEEDMDCICIPVYRGDDDGWTKFLIKYLKSKEMEARGVNFKALDALENYTRVHDWAIPFPKTTTGFSIITQIYDIVSLIVPRVAEIIVNIVLTGWLRVDGFSSSLVARRGIRDYVVDSTGTGFAANVFLTKAVVFGSADGTNVCQVLRFRGIFSLRRVSYIVCCINLICSVTWSVLIAWDGNWAHSVRPSTPRVAVIIGAVGVALGMDWFDFYRARALAAADEEAEARDRFLAKIPSLRVIEAQAQAQARARARVKVQIQARNRFEAWARVKRRTQVWGLLTVVILEVGYIVSLVVRLSMKGGLGRWVYSAMQLLVWVKWGIGSFLLGGQASQDKSIDFNPRMEYIGTWVYCSAFWLNAILAGVRGKWEYSI